MLRYTFGLQKILLSWSRTSPGYWRRSETWPDQSEWFAPGDRSLTANQSERSWKRVTWCSTPNVIGRFVTLSWTVTPLCSERSRVRHVTSLSQSEWYAPNDSC